jgi:hypothetical protein
MQLFKKYLTIFIFLTNYWLLHTLKLSVLIWNCKLIVRGLCYLSCQSIGGFTSTFQNRGERWRSQFRDDASQHVVSPSHCLSKSELSLQISNYPNSSWYRLATFIPYTGIEQATHPIVVVQNSISLTFESWQ